MSRVSVAAGQKPKPKESFKFLRRDEGRLSYSAAPAESPTKSGADDIDSAGRANRERRDSKALREAIAFDMRNAKSHDPLGEVVVAVPRKAPPPNRVASTPPPSQVAPERTPASSGAAPQSQQQQQRRPPARTSAIKRKPEWISPEVEPSPPPQAPVRLDPEQFQDRYPEPAYSDPYARGGAAAARVPSHGGDGNGNGADLGRYGGITPRSARVGAPRYASNDYEDASTAPSSTAERNYFRRPPYNRDPAPAPALAGGRSREEDDLIASLEQEIKAAQEERDHYAQARQQLDHEKQRFEAYRYGAQQQIEDELAQADDRRSRDQRDAHRDSRAAEERCKNLSALLVTERETNRRLTQENDSLRTQLEDLTSAMRETQGVHKAEVARMRRDIDSLTRRNAELLAMAKEQQLHALEGAASRQGNAARPVAVTRDSATASTAPRPSTVSVDGSEVSVDDSAAGGRRASRAAPAVMDFTPRSAAAESAAREKRNRQLQDRMQAEEEAMEERKRQREKWLADRRKEEQEKEARQRAAVAAAAAVARRQREEEEEQQRRAASEKPVEERKEAGHPVHTPRMQAGAGPVKRRPSASAPHPPVPRKRQRVPSKEELIGDTEEPPSSSTANDAVVSQTALGDNPNKKEVLYRSGKREIRYANGTVKVVLPSGHTTLRFTNGDVKCTFPSGKSTYWYDAAQTMHTQLADGVQTFEFRSTGQTEKHLPDGSKEILYPDGIYKMVRPDGTDETYYPDGEPVEE